MTGYEIGCGEEGAIGDDEIYTENGSQSDSKLISTYIAKSYCGYYQSEGGEQFL
jgi:hypothetical protein